MLFTTVENHVTFLSRERKVSAAFDREMFMRPDKNQFVLRRLSPLFIVLMLVPTFASGASASVKGPIVVVDCGKSSVRPASIVITCADANRYISAITWTNWGAATATAHGTLRWNDCSPTCVAGHWHQRAVTFSATTRRRHGGNTRYTRLHAAPSVWGESSPWWTLS
jgi:hypothetical protein